MTNLNHYGRKGMKWYQHIFGEKQTEAPPKKGAARKEYIAQLQKSRNRRNTAAQVIELIGQVGTMMLWSTPVSYPIAMLPQAGASAIADQLYKETKKEQQVREQDEKTYQELMELMRKNSDKLFSHSDLEHYGRKGMKWYQHIFGDIEKGAKYMTKKATGKIESMKKSAQSRKIKNGMKVAKDPKAFSKKGTENMSNAELKKHIERMRLMKDYEDAYNKLYPDPKAAKRERNQQLVNTLLKVSVEQGVPKLIAYAYEKNSPQVKANKANAEANKRTTIQKANKDIYEKMFKGDEKRSEAVEKKIKTAQDKLDKITTAYSYTDKSRDGARQRKMLDKQYDQQIKKLEKLEEEYEKRGKKLDKKIKKSRYLEDNYYYYTD